MLMNALLSWIQGLDGNEVSTLGINTLATWMIEHPADTDDSKRREITPVNSQRRARSTTPEGAHLVDRLGYILNAKSIKKVLGHFLKD